MGGKGGPYRVDSGNPVYQIPDEEKQRISAEIQAGQQEMRQVCFFLYSFNQLD
jgi:hypothetical protein